MRPTWQAKRIFLRSNVRMCKHDIGAISPRPNQARVKMTNLKLLVAGLMRCHSRRQQAFKILALTGAGRCQADA